jgi:hypothetical protein
MGRGASARDMTFCLAFVLGAIVACSSSPSDQIVVPLSTSVDVSQQQPTFSYLPGDCSLIDTGCAVGRGPKDWGAERVVVETAVNEIHQLENGSRVISAVQRLGITQFRRFAIGAAGDGVPAPLINASFRSESQRRDEWFIEFDDRFFSKIDAIDRRARYRHVTRIILHEMVHVIDDQGWNFSLHAENGPAFAAAVGFEASGWMPLGVTQEQVALFNLASRKIDALNAAGDFEAAWETGRDLGRTFNLPSYQAFKDARETFAEIGAHLLLEPEARAYLRPAVVTYFDERVLSKLETITPQPNRTFP